MGPVAACDGHDFPGLIDEDEQVGQDVDHVDRLELAIDADRQALVRELADHVEHPVLAVNRRPKLTPDRRPILAPTQI